MDHDQLFKTVIREFLPDFLRLFFPSLAERFDFDQPLEWLDKEVFSDPPEGDRHILDMVAKILTREPIQSDDPKSLLALIHIEIESPDRTTSIKSRLPFYSMNLSEKYQLPILPFVIYLRVGLDGIGLDACTRTFWETEIFRFNYFYVGLPMLSAEDYVQGENMLGVALSALMKIPKERIVEWGAEALRRLAESRTINPLQKHYLARCVQRYWPMSAVELAELEALLAQERYAEVQTMNRGVFEVGFESGFDKGFDKGMHEGFDKGMHEGFDKGMHEGFDKGMHEGFDKGVHEGFDKGVHEGAERGKREGILEGLAIALEVKFGADGVALAAELAQILELAKLEALKDIIRTASTIEQVRAAIRT